jgi:hypothetical protein
MEHDWIKRVKKLMSEKKITQQDLVPVLGVSTRGAVGHYLTGQSLANFLAVPINHIISGDSKEVSIDKVKLKNCLAVVSKVLENEKIHLSDDQQSKLVAYLYSETLEDEAFSEEKIVELIGVFA